MELRSTVNRRRQILRTVPLAFAIAVSCLPPDLFAQTAIQWGPPEAVDGNVLEVSTASSPASVYLGGTWHVFYAREGLIIHRARDAAGWSAPEPVSTSPGAARNPHAQRLNTSILVAWEDGHTGHPEIWSRVWTSGAWSAETCVTGDDVPSTAPALANYSNRVMLVWEEGIDPTQIFSRSFLTTWSAPYQLSHSSGSASEPTICSWGSEDEVCVAWTDTRSGTPQIYYRTGIDSWWTSETRIANLPGAARHPSICNELSGIDVTFDEPVLAFEQTPPNGVAEIWAACGWGLDYLVQVSPDDGVPSVGPCATSFAWWEMECSLGFPATITKAFLAWTDLAADRTHRVLEAMYCPSANDPREAIASPGLGDVRVITEDASPSAPLLALWLEEVGGGPTLMSRVGSTPSCSYYRVVDAPPILLIPGGVPADSMRLVEQCSGSPLSGLAVNLFFPPALDAALTWAPLQPHPRVPAQSDDQGRVAFTLRGGGCSRQDLVYIFCSDGNEFEVWPGAKSPDIDGDCAVRSDDVATIASRLGTHDFCADLDDSGLVDSTDVAFARSLVGSRCTDPADVLAPEDLGAAIGVDPNPCREQAIVWLRGAAAVGTVGIFDVSGRLVRALGAPATAARGASQPRRLVWDLRDDHGRAVPSGMYWVTASGAEAPMRRSLLVVR
jgi:hypothetical protein